MSLRNKPASESDAQTAQVDTTSLAPSPASVPSTSTSPPRAQPLPPAMRGKRWILVLFFAWHRRLLLSLVIGLGTGLLPAAATWFFLPDSWIEPTRSLTQPLVKEPTPGDDREKEHRQNQLEQSRQVCQQALAGWTSRLREHLDQAFTAKSSQVNSWLAGQLQERRLELNKAEEDLGQLRSQLLVQKTKKAEEKPASPPLPTVNPGSAGDVLLQKIRQRLTELEVQVAQIRRIAITPETAERLIKDRGLDTEIERIKKTLQQEGGVKSEIQNPKSETPPSSLAPPPSSLPSSLEIQVAYLEDARKRLLKEVEVLTQEQREVQKPATEDKNLMRDLHSAEQEVGQKVLPLLEPAQVTVSSPADLGSTEIAEVPIPARVRRAVWASLAGLGGLGLGLLGVSWWEVRGRRIRTPAEITQGLEIPVVGVCPCQAAAQVLRKAGGKEEADTTMPPWYEVSHPEIEALRAALAAPVPGSFLGQVVLLTSAESEEGTCSLAALLAASLARSGRRTLLIDAHLQTPLLHRTFQLPADPGLSEVLRGQVALAKAVRGLPLDRLWLLPAGQELPRALEKFEREEALTFLNQARKDYEYVLINGGPVLPNAEVLLLARRADEIFLAVRLGHSRFPNVHAAWQRLGIVEGLRGVVAV